MNAQFWCAFCFQENPVWVDLSGGSQQRYVEDCQVCCRPNRLTVWIRASDEGVYEEESLSAMSENHFTSFNESNESEANVIAHLEIDIESEPAQ